MPHTTSSTGVISTSKSRERKNRADTKSIRYIDMAEAGNWDLITSLMGGRRTMLAQRERYLPKQEEEKQRPYDARLSRTFLFEGFNDTIDKLSSKPFSRSVTVQGQIPEKLEVFKTDVDKSGKSLTQFTKELMTTGLRRGLTHILVDFPTMEFFEADGVTSRTATKAEETQAGVRPVFIEISPTQLIDWDEDENNNLIYARWIENTIERKERFLDETKQRIREMTDTTFEIFELQKKGDAKTSIEGINDSDLEWKSIKKGTHTFGSVPIVTFYTEQTGPRTASPPLRKLAEANLSHYQSGSDQRNLLNVARAGILLLTGFNEEDIEDGITIGPRAQLTTTNENADAKWVEHTGAAIEAGRTDLQDLENYMTILGTEPLVIRPGNRTATAEAIDEGKNQSSIQAWIRSLESTLEKAYMIAAEWLKIQESMPDDFKIDIFNEFGITIAGKKELDFLLKTRTAKQITQETFLKELKRRDVLTDALDIQLEVETTKDEQETLMESMFEDREEGDDGDDDDE